MKRAVRGFTLIEVLIAVLVLSVALGASLQAIGNYISFQLRISQRYHAQLVAWDAFMECYLQLRLAQNKEVECQTGGKTEQGSGYWEWEAVDQTGELVFHLRDERELSYPLTLRTIRVYAPDSRGDEVVADMTAILQIE